jgi:diguanylate cyclase (GGDEF)-like protein/PAS domain S-box-containing protein
MFDFVFTMSNTVFKLRNLIFIIGLLFALHNIAHAQSNNEKNQSLTPIHVQLNWHHQYQFGGFYAALQQGYYRQAGLDVYLHSYQTDMSVLDEVLAGRAHFGVGYSTTVADYIKGAAIQLVMASFQHSPMVLLTHEPIGDLSELSGKMGMYSDSMQVLSLLNKATKQTKKPIHKRQANTQLQEFINKNVDFYGAYITNEPFQLQELGVPYHIVDPKLYGVNSAEDLIFTTKAFANTHPAVVAAFREATIKGWQFAIENPDSVIDFMITHYNVPKSRRALFYEAKALTSYVSVGTRPIGVVEPARLKDTAVELKEIGLINQTQFDEFEPEAFMGLVKGKVNLTASELAYLAKHPIIYLANDIDWAPLEFIDDQGNFRGLVADYFKIFEKQLGVRFIPEKHRQWNEVKALARTGDLPIFSGTVSSPERREYMHFTDPYLSFPMVIVAKDNISYVSDYNQLNGQTIAVVRGYWSHEYFMRNYPLVNLLVTDSVKEALAAVITGTALAYSENLAVANYAMREYGFSGLTIVGESQERSELSIGVHYSEPMLFSIMQKALASVSEEDKRTIYDRWIHIELVKRLDPKQLWALSGYFFVIVGFLVILLLVYRYQRNRFQHYIRQINELNFASKIELATEKVVWVSQSYAQLRGCEAGDLIGQRYTEFASDRVSEEAIQSIKQELVAGKTWVGEVEGRRCDGESYWVKLTLTPQANWLGKTTHVWATRVDITDKKRIEALSNTDELTNLYNRHYFNKTLPSLQQQYQGSGKHLCLASIDIDYFKLINDTYGHLVGDRVLQQVADYLKSCCTEDGAMAFRLGGEEFMVVALVENVDRFYQQLNTLRSAILSARIENRDAPLGYLSISIGACCWPDGQPSDWDSLYRQVDDLLYQAKTSGRNQVVTAIT